LDPMACHSGDVGRWAIFGHLPRGVQLRVGNAIWTVRGAEITAAQPAAGARGDVEKPPEVAPSAIRRVLPPPAAGHAPQFSPPGARPGGSAATRVEATIVCMVIIAAVAVALIVYFATY
jgi:hypothetical protein